MKKFLLKVSVFVLYAVFWQVLFPIIVDPFNVFHVHKIRQTGTEPNKNYIKMKYILNNPKKFDSFIFGSSRVGALNPEKMTDEKCYNMTYSAGTPPEHLENIKTFLNNEITPSRIYIGMDSRSYTDDPNEHIYQPLRCPYEYLAGNVIHFCLLYLNPEDVRISMRLRPEKPDVQFTENFYKNGTNIHYGRKSKTDWDNKQLRPSLGSSYNSGLFEKCLDAVREIVKICREHNIELVLFMNPMHHITYMGSLDKGYFDFLRRLAEISEFYNFSGLNNITTNNDNYFETSHYKPEIGDIMINIMCRGIEYPELQAQGFGVKVNRNNINDLTALLKSQAESFKP